MHVDRERSSAVGCGAFCSVAGQQNVWNRPVQNYSASSEGCVLLCSDTIIDGAPTISRSHCFRLPWVDACEIRSSAYSVYGYRAGSRPGRVDRKRHGPGRPDSGGAQENDSGVVRRARGVRAISGCREGARGRTPERDLLDRGPEGATWPRNCALEPDGLPRALRSRGTWQPRAEEYGTPTTRPRLVRGCTHSGGE